MIPHNTHLQTHLFATCVAEGFPCVELRGEFFTRWYTVMLFGSVAVDPRQVRFPLGGFVTIFLFLARLLEHGAFNLLSKDTTTPGVGLR